MYTQVLLRMMKGKPLSFNLYKTVYIMIIVDLWYLGGEDIHILIINKL